LHAGMILVPYEVIKHTVMVNIKNPGQQGQKDVGQDTLHDDQIKNKNRETPFDGQRDTPRKNEKTAQSRKDQHGKK